jgi:hypothetical protein
MNAIKSAVLAISLTVAGCAASTDAPVANTNQELSGRALAAGRYRGMGQYVDPDAAPAFYAVEYVLTVDSIDMRYSWGEDKSRDEVVSLQLAWQSPTEFTFTGSGGEGTGYCLDDRCHFEAEWFEMSLVFDGGSLTGFGSREAPAHRVYWSDSLHEL